VVPTIDQVLKALAGLAVERLAALERAATLEAELRAVRQDRDAQAAELENLRALERALKDAPASTPTAGG
jgi:Tfp pilus assembly protein PilO